MSDYCHNKVIRMKVTPQQLGLDDVWDLEQIHKDLFDFKKNEPYMEIAPTKESFIDYVLSHTYGKECGEWGNARRLYMKEIEEYLPIFKKIYPNCTADDLRYVDYCWYNCSEAPDYFETDESDEQNRSELEDHIRQFLSTIAETKFTFEDEPNKAEREGTEEVRKYNEFLFRLAKKIGLPIEEEYEKVKESYKWENLLDNLPV